MNVALILLVLISVSLTIWAFPDAGLSTSANSVGCDSAAFSHDGSHLVCGYSNGTLEVERTDRWDRECGPLSKENHRFDYAAFSPNGSVILAAGDSEITLWNATTGSLRARFPIGYYAVTVRDAMWDGILGYARLCFGGHSSLAMFSHDSQYLVVGSDDGAFLWSVATGQLIRRFSGHTSLLYCVAFSLDAGRIATAYDDASIIIWNVNTGASLVTMTRTERYAGFVWCVAFSATGERVASGSSDDRVRVWNADTGQLLLSLAGHSDSVWSVAFAPRGDVVISSSGDDTMRFWDVETGGCLHVFDGKTWRRTMVVAPDGTGIVVGGGRVVQLWSPPEADALETTTVPWLPRRTWPIYYMEDGCVFSLTSVGQRMRLCWVPADWQLMASMSHTVVFGYRRKIDFAALQNYLDTLHATVQ